MITVSHRRRTAGFTLLELMVALTLLGLIASVAFGAMRVGSRSWEAGLKKANETAESRAVPTFLRRQLSQILPLVWEEAGSKQLAFVGERAQIRFIAPAPQRDQGVGLYEYLLLIDTRMAESSLVLHYEPYLPGETDFRVSEQSPQLVLVEGLTELSFGYYGAEKAKDASLWRDEWDRKAELLPRLLRISFMQEDQPQRPELLIPLHAEVAGG
jgi:general secretion pathway protein J